MNKFRIVPDIYEFDTFKEFTENFPIDKEDLLVTQKFIYEPFMKNLNLSCKIIFQEEFGNGEPSDVMVDAILKKTKGMSYKRVIAIGGGTVIDISKLLSLKSFESAEEIFDDPSKIIREKELILIPTTCGTGSEVTRSAIITSVQRKTKVRMAYDAYFADAAVLIPQLISTLPYRFFAYSSIDALIHGVESFLSPNATPYTDIFAMAAIRTIVKSFLVIANEGQEKRKDIEKDVLLASNYAGISFGNAGCGAVHALAFPLSGRYHVAHGESNYQFFCEVLRKYYSKNPEGKIKNLCKCLTEILNCNTDNVIDELSNLLNKIWPVKKLRDFGMRENEIKEFAEEVYNELQSVLATSYIPLTKEELEEINRNLY